MSHPANDHSDLSAPSLPAPGAAPTLTAPHPAIDSPSLPAPGEPSAPATALPPADAPGVLDGDLPRLGAAAITPALPTLAPALAPATPTAPTPTAPVPTGSSTTVDTTPVIDLPSLPSLPTLSPVLTGPSGLQIPGQAAVSDGDSGDAAVDTVLAAEPVHPMAHLMPEKAAPSEASRKAAELRAAKKAKAKKIKLGVTACMLVLTILVGPPLWSWLTTAINESGSTSTEEPAD